MSKIIQKCVTSFLDTPYSFSGKESPLIENEVVGERFFIEAGAYEGAHLSNSLFLEMKHKWTGLLVRLYLTWIIVLT